MDFSQYTQENQRVIQGMKDTLKALINKFGGTVDAEKIDQYPTLVDGIEVKGDAGDITYDNAESGLHSSNVQDAIDEVYKAQTSVIPENIVLSDDAELGEPFIADSDTLEGHPASYFAVAEETSTALNQKADLTFSNVVEKTTALENIGAMPKTYTGSDIPVSSEDSTKIKDALGNKADLTLSNLTDTQRALHNIGGRPNRNILINGIAVGGGDSGQFPINQRGQKTYRGGIAIDGWRISGNGSERADLQADGILLTSTAQYGAYWGQTVDPNEVEWIIGKTVTGSCYMGNINGFNPTLYVEKNGEYWLGVPVVENDITSMTFDVPEGTNSLKVYIAADGAGTTLFKAAKLEEGPVQTLGYKDSDGKVQLLGDTDYGEELTRCQRYLIAETAENEKPGTVYSSTSGVFTIPTAVQMRTTPVLLELKGYEPKIALSDGSTVLITKEEITVLGADVSGVRIRVDVTGGETLKLGPASIRDCNMVLSAEL